MNHGRVKSTHLLGCTAGVCVCVFVTGVIVKPESSVCTFLSRYKSFCLYVVGKVPKGILKHGSLRRTWWRAVVAEQISVMHCQFAQSNEIGATDDEQKQLRPGRGLRPFQFALLILGSRLAPTTSKVRGGPGHGSERRINLSTADRCSEAPVLCAQSRSTSCGMHRKNYFST